MDKKIIRLRQFLDMFEEYKKTGKQTIELKTVVMDDLINYIKESDVKTQILLSQKHNLVVALRNKGVKEEEIRKLLDLRMEK